MSFCSTVCHRDKSKGGAGSSKVELQILPNGAVGEENYFLPRLPCRVTFHLPCSTVEALISKQMVRQEICWQLNNFSYLPPHSMSSCTLEGWNIRLYYMPFLKGCEKCLVSSRQDLKGSRIQSGCHIMSNHNP